MPFYRVSSFNERDSGSSAFSSSRASNTFLGDQERDSGSSSFSPFRASNASLGSPGSSSFSPFPASNTFLGDRGRGSLESVAPAESGFQKIIEAVVSVLGNIAKFFTEIFSNIGYSIQSLFSSEPPIAEVISVEDMEPSAPPMAQVISSAPLMNENLQ